MWLVYVPRPSRPYQVLLNITRWCPQSITKLVQIIANDYGFCMFLLVIYRTRGTFSPIFLPGKAPPSNLPGTQNWRQEPINCLDEDLQDTGVKQGITMGLLNLMCWDTGPWKITAFLTLATWISFFGSGSAFAASILKVPYIMVLSWFYHGSFYPFWIFMVVIIPSNPIL